MEDSLITRAELLMQQDRYAEAENILGELLAADPNNVLLISMLSNVQLQKGNYDKAKELIDSAISREPDNSVLFYTKARVAIQQDEYDVAEDCLNESIALDPDDADAYALLASVKLNRKQYEQALSLANTSLEIDPENIIGLNIRSTSLLKLNRKEEAFETIEGALREDPENSYNHMNYGWGLLEKGDTKKALDHFREALKNDPSNEYAQAGMAQALKARYSIYRLYLSYAFWIGNLTQRYQWAVIIGFVFIVRLLRTTAKNNEALQPYLTPLVILLSLIAFSTWVITPISNLFLRLNKYGKHLLDKKEIISSNFVAVSAILFLLSLLMYAITQQDIYLATAVLGFTMMVPLGTMLSPVKKKYSLVTYTLVMATIGGMSILKTISTGELFNGYSIMYVFAFIGFQWIANFFLIKEDNI